MDHNKENREVVFIDGKRTPFLRSQTEFKTFSAYELGRLSVAGLINKTKPDFELIGHVYFGNVIQDINTSNVAREITLASGLPESVPATTISMACISSNFALTSACQAIQSGNIDCAIAGGVEVMSDIPIRLRKPFRQKLLEAQKYRKPTDWLSFLKGLSPSDLLPEIPSISEFSTGETMGQSCDKMTDKYEIRRKNQDKYALRSHQKAAEAMAGGYLKNEIIPVAVNDGNTIITSDNGIRGDSTLEKLNSLPPAFTDRYGSATAGNSSFLTDGASAGLVMEKNTALKNSYKPKAVIRNYTYVAQQPGDELLIGPAFAIPRVLDTMNITLSDIDVFEFHEAFAGQMLTVLKALESTEFARERLNREKPVGTIPDDKLNRWGGSLSIGHPFAATGMRLVTTAANRLIHEDGQYALIAACAAGGQGHAMIIERYKGA
jgi:acetyl-CoA acetyltransferase family protein